MRIQSLNTPAIPFTIEVADQDGDGRRDILASYYQAVPTWDGGVAYYQADGAGQFKLPVTTGVGTLINYYGGFADFDGDGRLDGLFIDNVSPHAAIGRG